MSAVTQTRPGKTISSIGAVALLAATVALGGGGSTTPVVTSGHDDPSEDFARVLGPDACGECHMSELAAWKLSSHATGFTSMHREIAAKEIATRLGIKRIKKAEECRSCHYTTMLSRDKPKASHGVSCESCHGPARDWIEIHDDYGAGHDEDSEPEAHREARRSKARAHGMRAPGGIYDLGAACYGCHVIADERLVNDGGHPAGKGLELVAATQGEVRHNYLASEGETNAEASLGRRRQLFLVGRGLALEHALRARGKATKPGPYLDAAREGVKTAIEELAAVDAALGAPFPFQGALKLAREPKPAPSVDTASAADAVAAATKAALASLTPRRLAGLDPLLPAAATYVGKPAR